MRADLEAAMAAVISSQAASERLLDDPSAFAKEFALAPPEAAMLIDMAGDLALLTSSFVHKRCTTLRWNAHRTLELLGPEGDELVEEFVEATPMSSHFREDAAAFGDFVVARTAARAAGEAGGLDEDDAAGDARVIAAMASFERHRSDSFWDATKRLDLEEEGAAARHREDGAARVRLVAGANIGRFEWDMRLPYRHRIDPLDSLPQDSCQLLFFHSAREPVLRALRLRPAEADLVEGALRAGAYTDEQLGARLSWEGAVEWA
ncbi:MAG: hypothetical protein ACLQK4_13110 [Acidimicrobiales bacterium]